MDNAAWMIFAQQDYSKSQMEEVDTAIYNDRVNHDEWENPPYDYCQVCGKDVWGSAFQSLS